MASSYHLRQKYILPSKTFKSADSVGAVGNSPRPNIRGVTSEHSDFSYLQLGD